MTDLRVTPTQDLTVNKVPGAKDNPSLNGLTVDRLGMEVAGELGVDLSASGLAAQKVRQYEQQTHSGRKR